MNKGQFNEIKVPNQPWAKIVATVYLPTDWDSKKAYPLICFFHGVGERGTDIKKLYNQGLPEIVQHLAAKGKDLQSSDGTKFIVLAMQDGYFSPRGATMVSGVDSLQKEYGIKIDTARIYITGLSSGGQAVLSTMKECHDTFAASVCMSPAAGLDMINDTAETYKDRYVWFFQGMKDATVSPQNAITSNSEINEVYPGHSKITLYPTGHDHWNDYYNPDWKENGISIYDWMLQYKLVDVQEQPPVVVPPIVENPAPVIIGLVATYSDGTTKALI